MIIVKVTQEHIDKGYCQDPWCCPVALACQEAGLVEASVSIEGVMWTSASGLQMQRYLPRHAEDKVDNYDKTGIMFPFEFAMI